MSEEDDDLGGIPPADTPREITDVPEDDKEIPTTISSPPEDVVAFGFQKVPTLEQHKADTARFLAFGIVILLGIAYLAHFITTCVLIGMDKLDARALKEVSSSWLPVLAGLASSAATYYFTKER